jgi:hypothetical protein
MQLDKTGIHYSKFKELAEGTIKYKGRNPAKWVSNEWFSAYGLKNLPTVPFTRDDLFDYCSNVSNSHHEVLFTILAWGGMRKSNANKLIELYDEDALIQLISKLRTDANNKKNTLITRSSIYNDFMRLKQENKIPGLGIGYFTKLICFLAPNLKGYIMDQWVSKSINLIYGDSLVKLTNDWVNNNNHGDIYETYCSRIDDIAKDLKCKGFEAEERLFSIGGINRGDWRAYLMKKTKRA